MSTCQHRNTIFSRDICPDPCGVMHTWCADCGVPVDDCPNWIGVAQTTEEWTPQQAQAAQAELDELERTDPDVAAAAASHDRMVERMTGRTLTTSSTHRLPATALRTATGESLVTVREDRDGRLELSAHVDGKDHASTTVTLPRGTARRLQQLLGAYLDGEQ